MTRLITRLTGAAALLGLGVLGGAVLASPAESDRPAAAVQRAAPVEVRTEVVRRTIRIVKHEKPKRVHAATAPAAAPPPAAAPAVVTQPMTRVSASAPAPAAHRLVSRSSGTGHGGDDGHERSHDGEGGGDD